MSNTKPQYTSPNNFWLGFILGAGATTAGLYFFGTQTGRQKLRNALDATENLEHTLEDVYTAAVETYTESHTQQPQVINSQEVSSQNTSTIGSLQRIYALVKLFSTKYNDRRKGVQEAELV